MYKALFTLTFITIIIIGSMYAVDAYNQDMKAYQQSSACISKYISQGIERSDIVVTGNTCSLK